MESRPSLLALSLGGRGGFSARWDDRSEAERNITFTLLCSGHGKRPMMPPHLERTMQTAVSPDATVSANGHVLRALQLNKDHQAAVKTQIERLEGNLATLDKLLVEAGSHTPLPGN